MNKKRKLLPEGVVYQLVNRRRHRHHSFHTRDCPNPWRCTLIDSDQHHAHYACHADALLENEEKHAIKMRPPYEILDWQTLIYDATLALHSIPRWDYEAGLVEAMIWCKRVQGDSRLIHDFQMNATKFIGIMYAEGVRRFGHRLFSLCLEPQFDVHENRIIWQDVPVSFGHVSAPGGEVITAMLEHLAH